MRHPVAVELAMERPSKRQRFRETALNGRLKRDGNGDDGHYASRVVIGLSVIIPFYLSPHNPVSIGGARLVIQTCRSGLEGVSGSERRVSFAASKRIRPFRLIRGFIVLGSGVARIQGTFSETN